MKFRFTVIGFDDVGKDCEIRRLPRFRIRFKLILRDATAVFSLQGDLAAMALLAADECAREAVDLLDIGHPGRRGMRIEEMALFRRIGVVITEAFDFLGKKIVQRGENVARLRVMAGGEFFVFPLMTTVAIPRRDDRRNERTVMREGIGVPFVCLVTFETADPFLRVCAEFPMLDDAGRILVMARHARFR